VPEAFDHRTFVRLDDGYPEHPKVVPLSDGAFRAHIEAICWASRNEGRFFVPRLVARKFWRPKFITELINASLFDEATDGRDGYEVHDYLDFNRSTEEIAAFRESRGDAGALGNHRRWHVARRKWDKDCEHCKKEGRLGIAN